MATYLTEDCCDNEYVKEILEFRTPRTQRLFHGWTRAEVVALVGRVIHGGVSVVSERGVLLGLWRGENWLHVYAILGAPGFLRDVAAVWRDVYPDMRVTGLRRGRVYNFNLNNRKNLWEAKK